MKVKYEMCPHCEACFKLAPGTTFPEHTFRGKRCEMSGKPITRVIPCVRD